MQTEADTCRTLVLPKLYKAGWNDDQIGEQRSFTDGRIVVALTDYTAEKVRTLCATPTNSAPAGSTPPSAPKSSNTSPNAASTSSKSPSRPATPTPTPSTFSAISPSTPRSSPAANAPTG